MSRFISTRALDREQWLALRRQGLGGSDAATLVGLNPYGSLSALYADKKGLLPPAGTPAMQVGQALEDLVARLWQQRTGKRCRRVHGIHAHDQIDYFRAALDRKVVGENAGLELKVAGAFTKLDLEGAQPPGLYQCQCQWYMMVCGFDRMYLAALKLGGYQLYDWVVPRDENMIAALRRAGQDFWRDHILADRPPAPDGSDLCAQALDALCPPPQDGPVRLDGQAPLIQDYVDLGGRIDALKKQRDRLSQQLRLALDGHAQGEGGGYRVSWINQRRESLDGAALKKALPLVYRQFARYKSFGMLRVTAAKGGAPLVD